MIPVLALLLAAAPVATPLSPAGAPDPSPAVFGQKGALALSSDFRASLGYLDYGGSSGFQMVLLPAADYFVGKGISVGGQLGVRLLTGGGDTAANFSITPRAGLAIPVSPQVSLWPRFGLQLQFGDFAIGDLPVSGASETTFGIDLSIPVLFHVSPHFFVGAGPRVVAQVVGDLKETSATLDFTLGGWL